MKLLLSFTDIYNKTALTYIRLRPYYVIINICFYYCAVIETLSILIVPELLVGDIMYV